MKNFRLPGFLSKALGRRNILFAAPPILLVAVVLIAYCRTNSDDQSRYEFVTVQRGHLVKSILSTGTINPITTVPVGSQLPGKIEKIYVDYNSLVHKGMLLALIEPRMIKAQLAEAEANLAGAKAQVEKTEVELKESEHQFIRKRNLFKAEGISRSDLDVAETAYYSLCAEKKTQEARVAQFEGAVRAASISLEHTRITSPIDGVVLSRNIEVGQLVAADAHPQDLFDIATDLSQLKIAIDVSEADVGSVEIGQVLFFHVDAYPGRTFSGKVGEIHIGPSIKQNTVYYTVMGYVDNTGLPLRPGMTADVWIQTASKEGVLTIPALAVSEQNANYYVTTLDGNEVRKREIRIGIKGEGGVTEVLSGLGEGERIILPGKPK